MDAQSVFTERKNKASLLFSLLFLNIFIKSWLKVSIMHQGWLTLKKIEILTLSVNALFLKYLVSVFLYILPPAPQCY